MTSFQIYTQRLDLWLRDGRFYVDAGCPDPRIQSQAIMTIPWFSYQVKSQVCPWSADFFRTCFRRRRPIMWSPPPLLELLLLPVRLSQQSTRGINGRLLWRIVTCPYSSIGPCGTSGVAIAIPVFCRSCAAQNVRDRLELQLIRKSL